MRALLHPLFTCGLLLLVLNDHYLKAIYHNWWTGKLSDFAGLFVFAVFVESLRRLFVSGGQGKFPWGILVAGAFFAWFKSPLSEGALEVVSAFFGRTFTRVVDYSDLLALTMLYPVYRLMAGREAANDQVSLPRPALAVLIPLSLVAFVATSEDDGFLFNTHEVTFCCDSRFLKFEVGNGIIYLPSAFTPDADGINDVFFPIPDSNIVRVDSFTVYSKLSSQSVYVQKNITDFSPGGGLGFDGLTLDSLPPQVFYYNLTATSRDSVTSSVSGEVCALPCDRFTLVPRPDSAAICVYGNQYVPGVGFDTSIPSGEELDCFKQ